MSDPPRVRWLIEHLSKIKHGADPNMVLWHAYSINLAAAALHGRSNTRGHSIERDDGGELRRVRTPTRGPRRELEELRRAAKRAIRKAESAEWMTAWASCSQRTRSLVWSPAVPPIIEKHRDGSGRLTNFRRASVQNVLSLNVPGLSLLGPFPKDALPLIESAIARLRTRPAKERQKRKADQLVEELSNAIKAAFVELSGKRLTRPVLRGKPQLDSPALALARDIDEKFGLAVFTTVDSQRLRKLF